MDLGLAARASLGTGLSRGTGANRFETLGLCGTLPDPAEKETPYG
jgi:hypothetical protein